MSLKVAATVFVMVFLAELGDKTQLATLAFAGAEKEKWSVFIGSALALVTAAALATLLGAFLSTHLSPVVIRKSAGALFIAFGLFYLIR